MPAKDFPDRSLMRRLAPPVQGVRLAGRPLLLRSLDVARSGRLCLIVGPPGYGKTTALALWWQRQRDAGALVAWYSASDEDQSAIAFLLALARSLDAAGIGLGSAFSSALEGAHTNEMMATILHAMEQIDKPIVLIVDEFEKVDRPHITHLIETLILDAPSNLTVALATRRRPTLEVSQLRAQGMVRVIEVQELRFNKDEVASLCQLDQQSEEIEYLMAVTEGWPIAVQLYRLLQEQTPAGEMPFFNGRLDNVADYLTEQVLATIPSECRDLITDLSFFDFVEAPLLDAVRQRSDSANLLHELHQLLPGLVQQMTADGVIAYRLHPLIADFGRGRLTLDKERSNSLELRASDWLWDSERYPAAIRHRVRAGSRVELASKLATLELLPIFLANGAHGLRVILREIPKEILKDAPRLQLMGVLAHFKTGLFEEASGMLQSISERTSGYQIDPMGHSVELRIEGLALELFFRYIYEDRAPTVQIVLMNYNNLQ